MTEVDLIDHPVATADDVLSLLLRLKDGGFNLTDIEVSNGCHDAVGSMTLTQRADGKHALLFWLRGD